MRHYLAFDGGGTATRAGLYDEEGHLLREARGGASNPVALGVNACIWVLTQVGREALAGTGLEPEAVGVALSGAWTSGMASWLANRLCEQFRAARAVVCDDIRPVLFANIGDSAGVLAIAGTGSSVVAQMPDGRSDFVGGRGAAFGDYGSAYQIGQSALKAAGHALDGLGPETVLVDLLPKAAGVESFRMLVPWAWHASMRDIAGLAETVAAAAGRDAVAAACIAEQAGLMAEQVRAGFRKLELPEDAPVLLNGGLFEHCPRYVEAFRHRLEALGVRSAPRLAPVRGHRAALALVQARHLPKTVLATEGRRKPARRAPAEARIQDVFLERLSPTEIVMAMNRLDSEVPAAVARVSDSVALAMEWAAAALSGTGRLIYIGAGTSGRLGVLDASECPPTFGVDPGRVLGIIAGGDAALRTSAEGAEDDTGAALRDLENVQPPIGTSDVVIGIAASGTTPYTLAALVRARDAGARTVLLCCSICAESPAELTIAIDTGPEIVAGSTRLKAGTAMKMALNTISTGAMALSGRVFEGMMVGMRPTNQKLRRRAVAILQALLGLEARSAARLLHDADDDIRTAVVMCRLGMSVERARELLAGASGNLRAVLEAVQDRGK
ncbi:MAG TPA: N-acetylmuramic acid 6-phosphate etherase [Candidatus Hydrogenedentes bacterium]|nr:N-acetylmuramic acid 6-phosphate etherase [Candidatus Hydrogenedentota bacterium]